ncbi:MAG: hypothetical protein QXQ46_08060 [Thermoplasmatales archaeon]
MKTVEAIINNVKNEDQVFNRELDIRKFSIKPLSARIAKFRDKIISSKVRISANERSSSPSSMRAAL